MHYQLAKSFAALPPEDLVVIHDGHINCDKNGALAVAADSVVLVASTEGKCYSIAEMDSPLAAIGFQNFEFRPAAVDRSVITARQPRT